MGHGEIKMENKLNAFSLGKRRFGGGHASCVYYRAVGGGRRRLILCVPEDRNRISGEADLSCLWKRNNIFNK